MRVIRSVKSKKAKKDKRTKNDLQKIAQKKNKERTTGTPLNPGDDIRFCERGNSSCFTSDTRRVSDKRHELI